MTVSSQTSSELFVGNGVTVDFPLPFRFFENGDINAYFIDPDTGVSTPLSIGTDYTLTGAGEPEIGGSATGVLTTTIPVVNLVGLYVERILPLEQSVDIINQGEFFAQTHEDVFDRLTMLIQQVGADSQGAIRVAVGDPEPNRLAPAASRANQLMGFNSEGHPIAVAPVSGSSAELAMDLANSSDPAKGAAMVARALRHINSLAELRALAGQYDGEVVYLRGRASPGMLGAGNFQWDAASALADDDGVVIGSGTGRWFRVGTNFECHGEWFGVGNDGADYTAELQKAIDFAAVAVGGGQGMRVGLLRGKLGLSDKITLPNRVAIHGANGRGTVIEALDSFNAAATEMFHAVNGTSSMFGSRLVDLHIDMRGKGAAAGRCIFSQAWQETCGMERVTLIGFPSVGLELSNGYGGAAYLPLKDIEIFGGNSGTTPSVGIKVNQISLVGGFVLSIDGATITGSPTAQLPVGISMVNDTLVAKGLHYEYCDNGTVGSGIGGISIDTVTGNATVDTLTTLGSAWTGQLNIRNSITNGAANHVRNAANGAVIPAGAGMQPQITYPDKGQSQALGYVLFDASATGVGAQATIISKSTNISGVLKTAVGKFTVQWAYAQPSGKQRSVGGGITNLDNTDPIKVTHTGSTTTTEIVQVRRKTSDTTWNDYDPQRLSLQFFGDRL